MCPSMPQHLCSQYFHTSRGSGCPRYEYATKYDHVTIRNTLDGTHHAIATMDPSRYGFDHANIPLPQATRQARKEETVTRIWITMALTLIGGSLGARQANAQPAAVLDKDAATTELTQLSDALESISQYVERAVVQIFATTYSPVPNSPTGAFSQQRTTGSGVILDPTGYIVTNAHVVSGARRVQVLLAQTDDARPSDSVLRPRGELVGAQVIAKDYETDLAVLKIPRKGLEYLELGDSDQLRKGELVFAFGSPLGLENTVTMGVVSSVARQLRPEDPMIYLQTDAAINPGNSGGPLVNIEGEVVGINTFILSQSGGSQGLGFAAPSNIVRNVYQQIRESGRVRRGEIGMNAQTLNPALAAGLGLSRDWGVLVGDVYPQGPAARAGIKAGDIVMSLDGRPMENGRQLAVNLYGVKPGDTVKLDVLRGKERMTKTVDVIERRPDLQRFAELLSPKENSVLKLGILALDLDSTVAAMLPSVRYQEGVVVAAILREITAWNGPLLPGDVVYEANQRRTRDMKELREALNPLAPGSNMVLHVERQGQLMYLAFEVEY